MRIAPASIAALSLGVLVAASAFAASPLSPTRATPSPVTSAVSIVAAAPHASSVAPHPITQRIRRISWGVMKSLAASEKHGLCRFDTVQNNFSLINRRCESELAQVCRRENIGLLPFSPLGGGVLTGKYMHGDPPGARFTEYRKLGERQQRLADRFLNDRVRETVSWLKEIADDLSITLTALCLAWSKQHDFVASTIVGATTVAQLNESLGADGLVLSKETLSRIDEIDVAIPTPMKEDGLRRL